jgi:hypothetical protein
MSAIPGSKRLAITCLALAAAAAVATAEPTTEAKLPEAVQKTFRAAYPQAEIQKLDVEEENGVMVYDFEFKDGDAEKETDIAADGTQLEHTLVIPVDQVPAAAMKTISKVAKGATIGRVEHIEVSYDTKNGKPVKLESMVTRYAAEMKKGNKAAEVIVNADGTVFEGPEWAIVPGTPAEKK